MGNFKLIFAVLLTLVLQCCSSVTKIKDIQEFEMTGGTFDLCIHVIITEDTVAALKKIRLIYSDANGSDLEGRGATLPTNNGYPVVLWLSSLDKEIVIHELYHVNKDVMTWAGIELSDDTEEIYAYELQYLYTEFYKHVK